MKHLSDEGIQAYLDGGAGAERARTAAHLLKCSECQRALDEYRDIYVALEEESFFAQEMHIATRVLTKVRTLEIQGRGRDFVDTLAGASGITLALGVAAWVCAWLGGFEPGLVQLSDGLKEFLVCLKGPFAALSSSVMPAAHEIGTVVMAGFTVYLLLALDYLFLNHTWTAGSMGGTAQGVSRRETGASNPRLSGRA